MSAVAGVGAGNRIQVRTRPTRGMSFEELLEASKRVSGGRFANDNGDKYWHYPLSLDTCHALRRSFGQELAITRELADWYRAEAAQAQNHIALAAGDDGTLTRVAPGFMRWLRPYQRAGAAWVAEGYRNAGLVADTPGVGKTGETIAGVLEAGLAGPVLIVCPRPSVRLVWGRELAQHVPDVPTYLCYGSRARREKELKRFNEDCRRKPHELRFVVVVAEMLRVDMGEPCLTKGSAKISSMCPQVRRNPGQPCRLHARQWTAEEMFAWGAKKHEVPVGFAYPQLFDIPSPQGWVSIILDESHKLLGSLTIVKGNLMGRGLKLLPSSPEVRKYAMSGTPFGKGGRVQGMFGTLNWLWPDEYTSFWKWAAEQFEVREKVVNRAGKTVKQVVGLRGLASNATEEEKADAMERFLRTLGPRILRRTKAEVLPDLPPKAWYEVPCAMTAAQAVQYKALATFAEVKTKGGMVVPNGGLAVLTRERQIANGEINLFNGKVRFTGSSGKLDQLWEKLDAHGILDGAPGTKIVVASEFNEFLDIIEDRLSQDQVDYFRLDGKTTDKNRDAQVAAWQAGEGPERVFLVNSVAAGLSINLDAADEMHIMDERWNPEENEQLEDRIHRASRDHKVSIWYYRTEGTIDYSKAHSVEMKRRAQHAVLDGARGVAYVREMMTDAFDGVEVEG